MISRSRAAELGRETVAILQAGSYQAPSGKVVSIRTDLDLAVQGSCLHRPHEWIAGPGSPSEPPTPTLIEVTDESTVDAARRLDSASPGCDPCCLNFASAKHPGGGFLSGARAQEECLARSSGLYACIGPVREMYDHNRSVGTCLYSDYMIYSPRVPVFRDDEGTLLEVPCLASFITAPAVNAGAVKGDDVRRIEQTMRRRAEKVLLVAHHHGHRALVLGAWGCGVFRNDPAAVAGYFAELLGPGGAFHNVFRHVLFAVLDYSERKETLEPFRSRFSGR